MCLNKCHKCKAFYLNNTTKGMLKGEVWGREGGISLAPLPLLVTSKVTNTKLQMLKNVIVLVSHLKGSTKLSNAFCS